MGDFKQAKSKATKEKIRLSLMGKRNPNNRSVVESHYIVEKMLGRELKKSEVVHHIDGDFTNNSPSNLQVMDDKEHRRYHAIKQGFGKDRTNSKVTEEQIKEIILSGSIHAKELAKKFKVSDMTIYYIWRNYGRK